MDSRIAKELKIRHQPAAIIFTDDKPEAVGSQRNDADNR